MRASTVIRALGTALVGLFLLGAFTPLSARFYHTVAVPARIAPADAIVVLAGGGVLKSGQLTDVSLRRTARGITLYRRGLAPILVLSGAPNGMSESAARAVLARECGVPEAAIVATAAGYTTHEEVAALQSLLRARGAARLLLVTDAAHMRRSLRLLERAGFEVLAAPVYPAEGSVQPELRLQLLREAVRESLALTYYHVAGYLGRQEE
jgi:uncharacterized SAM-binding protein YcdF (DUF218 family)